MAVAFLLSPYGTCYWLWCAWGSLCWYTPFCGGKIEELEKTMMKHVVVKYIVQMYINCVVFWLIIISIYLFIIEHNGNVTLKSRNNISINTLRKMIPIQKFIKITHAKPLNRIKYSFLFFSQIAIVNKKHMFWVNMILLQGMLYNCQQMHLFISLREH